MVYFVGAGSGAVDLITVRGQRLLRQADVVIYAGSLVNPQLLQETRPDCRLYNSAKMTLEEVLEVIGQAEREGATIVRLHTGDPCLYGAIREQMDQLDDLGIAYEYVPGVSSFCAAAAALNAEYTLPDVSQTVIITRMAGRTPVPEKEEIAKLAAHQATMVIFLSTGLLEGLQERLMAGGYSADTPAAIVYKASWPDQKVFRCTVSTLAQTAKENNITKTALILVGNFLGGSYSRSKLYDPSFTTEFRRQSSRNQDENDAFADLLYPKRGRSSCPAAGRFGGGFCGGRLCALPLCRGLGHQKSDRLAGLAARLDSAAISKVRLPCLCGGVRHRGAGDSALCRGQAARPGRGGDRRKGPILYPAALRPRRAGKRAGRILC